MRQLLLTLKDGEAFLHHIDLHSVKYAELYRGADALRYVSIALGGAVNFVTFTSGRGLS
jgi:outer membrane cobalamin receptor